MSCSNCGSEYCDGEKCDENGGQDPFPDPVNDEDTFGDDTEDLPDDDGLDEDDDSDPDDDDEGDEEDLDDEDED